MGHIIENLKIAVISGSEYAAEVFERNNGLDLLKAAMRASPDKPYYELVIPYEYSEPDTAWEEFTVEAKILQFGSVDSDFIDFVLLIIIGSYAQNHITFVVLND